MPWAQGEGQAVCFGLCGTGVLSWLPNTSPTIPVAVPPSLFSGEQMYSPLWMTTIANRILPPKSMGFCSEKPVSYLLGEKLKFHIQILLGTVTKAAILLWIKTRTQLLGTERRVDISSLQIQCLYKPQLSHHCSGYHLQPICHSKMHTEACQSFSSPELS